MSKPAAGVLTCAGVGLGARWKTACLACPTGFSKCKRRWHHSTRGL